MKDLEKSGLPEIEIQLEKINFEKMLINLISFLKRSKILFIFFFFQIKIRYL